MPASVRPGSLSSRLNTSATVLVVEDEHDIAAFLGAYFRANGYAMVHVDPQSTEEVVHAIAEHDPACVLMDLRLRGLSGLDCYRHLRDAGHLLLPVIMVTAETSTSARLAALRGGIDAFVNKPFNVKELFELVVERIGRAELQADVGHLDAPTGAVTHGFLQARLADELAMAMVGAEGRDDAADATARGGLPVAFGLVRLSSAAETTRAAGAAAVDFVLRTVTARLAADLGPETVIGRSAHDELGVLFPAAAGSSAEQVSTRLAGALDAAAEPVELPGVGRKPLPVVLQAGLACHPDDASDPDALYMAADHALARAGETGATISRAI